jgi:phosphatidylserine/phosphatidylglycerophosphate/cardiolipin synthase-like enzyme
MLADVGAKIRHMKALHGKMMLSDGLRTIVGSINLSPGAFDDRRELAIELDEAPITRRLGATFDHDWHRAHHIDLTDHGILKDLEKHGSDALEWIFVRQQSPEKVTGKRQKDEGRRMKDEG